MAPVSSKKAAGKFKAGEDLRRRLLEAASRLFRKSGYERISVRSIAREVGCSQMAMYRHFPDKESLVRHLCNELYRQFTAGLQTKFDHLDDPKERLSHALLHFVRLAAANPHHYRFTFLARIADPKAESMRTEAAQPVVSYIRQNLTRALPPRSSPELVEERLHQILALAHGLIVMLITYPGAYRITLAAALGRLDSALTILVQSNSMVRGPGMKAESLSRKAS